MKRKIISFLMICLISGLVFGVAAGFGFCKKPVEVEWVTWGPSPLVEKYFQERFELFEKLNPDIKVKWQLVGDYVDKMIVLFAAGESPDVISTHTLIHDSFMSRNMLLALDSYIDGPNGLPRDDFPLASWEAVSMKGKTYGIPQTTGGVGLMYNRDLFDKAGIAYPTEDWTWDDLKNAAGKLTVKKGARVIEYGFTQDWISWTLIDAIYKAGGRMWNEDKTASALDSPQVKKVFSFWKELIDEGIAAGPKLVGTAGQEAQKFFAMGKTAMMIGGTWQVMAVKAMSPNLNFAATQTPRNKTNINVVFDTDYAISAQTKVADEAWRIAKFLESPEGLLITWQSLWNSLPARYSTRKMKDFKKITGIPGFVPSLTEKEFGDLLNWELEAFQKGRTSTEYTSPYVVPLLVNTTKLVEEVFVKGMSIDKALKNCVAELNKVIKRGIE